MDQQDGVSRRDAVIGISFLGALMLAMSATIAYRLTKQRSAGPRKAPLITVAPPVEAEVPSPFARFDDAVETVAHEAPAPEASNDAAVSNAPVFIAPAAR